MPSAYLAMSSGRRSGVKFLRLETRKSLNEITFGGLRSGGGIVIVQRAQELRDRACLALRCRPICLLGCDPVISAGIRLHDAGMDREALALDQTRIHACPHHRLEHMPKGIGLAKATVTIDGKRRMVGDRRNGNWAGEGGRSAGGMAVSLVARWTADRSDFFRSK